MWDRKGKGREKEREGKRKGGTSMPCLAGDSRTFHTLLEAQQLQDSAPLNLEGKFCSLLVFFVRCFHFGESLFFPLGSVLGDVLGVRGVCGEFSQRNCLCRRKICSQIFNLQVCRGEFGENQLLRSWVC